MMVKIEKQEELINLMMKMVLHTMMITSKDKSKFKNNCKNLKETKSINN